MFSHRQLVEVDAIEGEVLVVDRVQGAPHHTGLHLDTGIEVRVSFCHPLCDHPVVKYVITRPSVAGPVL